jgi:tetratricopeptide (TPR) repeat protein
MTLPGNHWRGDASGSVAIADDTASGIQAIHPVGALERARLAASMGKWQAAVRLLAERLESAAGDAEALGLYGWCLSQSGGDLEAARDACRRAVDMQPYVAQQHARLGHVYLAAGLARRAAACFDTALGLEPEQGLALEGRALLDDATHGARWRNWLRRAARHGSEPHPA